MKPANSLAHCSAVLWVVAILPTALSADILGLRDGEVDFEARTNVPALKIHGSSSPLEGGVTVHTDGDQLLVERVQVRISVPSLRTGMKIRDKHMRSEVFNTKEGYAPDLVFEGDDLVCPVPMDRIAVCEVHGTFLIRGKPRRLAMTLEIQAGDTPDTFLVAGDGVVTLSDYGIDRPSQFGVRVNDEVAIHVSFVADRRAGTKPSFEASLP